MRRTIDGQRSREGLSLSGFGNAEHKTLLRRSSFMVSMRNRSRDEYVTRCGTLGHPLASAVLTLLNEVRTIRDQRKRFRTAALALLVK